MELFLTCASHLPSSFDRCSMKIISFCKTPWHFCNPSSICSCCKSGQPQQGVYVPRCTSPLPLADWWCPKLPLSPFVISCSRLPWAHPTKAHNHQKHLTKISGLSQCLLLVFFSPFSSSHLSIHINQANLCQLSTNTQVFPTF